MAMIPGHRLAVAALALAALAAAIVYLHDPPWLIHTTHGFHGWETDVTGRSFRRTSGRASFFVPAEAAVVEVPLAADFESAQDSSVIVTLTIDDRPAEHVELTDDRWRTILLRLPPRGSRRVRRIDVRVDRMRRDERGVKIGEIRPRS